MSEREERTGDDRITTEVVSADAWVSSPRKIYVCSWESGKVYEYDAYLLPPDPNWVPTKKLRDGSPDPSDVQQRRYFVAKGSQVYSTYVGGKQIVKETLAEATEWVTEWTVGHRRLLAQAYKWLGATGLRPEQ